MNNIKLDVYLFFTGNCREAMEFYKNIFGGELTIQTVGEAQVESMPGMNDNMVMHAELRGGDIDLIGSDGTRTEPYGVSSISLTLSGNNGERLREIFNALSEGGKVTMPLEKAFWGAIFGTVTDKYGVDWMINITS